MKAVGHCQKRHETAVAIELWVRPSKSTLKENIFMKSLFIFNSTSNSSNNSLVYCNIDCKFEGLDHFINRIK